MTRERNDDEMRQGGQGPGQGRGANAGEVHADEIPGEDGTGPGLSSGLHGKRTKSVEERAREERSKKADAGIATEQEGPTLGKEELKHLPGDAGVPKP